MRALEAALLSTRELVDDESVCINHDEELLAVEISEEGSNKAGRALNPRQNPLSETCTQMLIYGDDGKRGIAA